MMLNAIQYSVFVEAEEAKARGPVFDSGVN